MTAGPYQWSRNPIYVAVLLILAGWALTFRTTPLWIYGACVAVAFHVRILLVEEPRLRQAHGAAWQRYQARVRRWI